MTRRRTFTAALAASALLAGLGPAAAAPANVSVGSSGWEWGSPLPQGNTLRALAFNGPRGYAVGDFGTLLATADGGGTWTGLRSGTFTALTEVQAVDADTVVAGGGCVGRRSDDGGRTFARIAFTPVESSCKEPLAALAFPLKRTGFIVLADGTVLQTTDGGTEFAQKVAVPGTRSAPGGGQATPTDATFLSATVGFVTTSDGKVARTIDAGNTWSTVSDTGRAVRGIVFADAQTGYAVGAQSLFLKTTDGGVTWVPKDIGAPVAQELTQIRCISLELCVAATAKGDVLVRTADGAATFTFPSPSTDPVNAAAFASQTRLVAAGASGSTVLSDDAGRTFVPIGARALGQFSRVRAGLVAGTAFAPGSNGALARTVDGGRTWQRGNVSTSEDVLDVAFPTADVGYALDVDGGLFRTASGGAAWRTLDKGTTARPNAIHATDAARLLLIGPRGVRRTTDAGETFSQVRSGAVARTQLSGVDRAGAHVVAWGDQAIVRSSDAGKSWTTVPKPGKATRVRGKFVNRLSLRKVDFVSATTGFALDRVGRTWRTRNGGKSWTELPGTGTDRAFGLAFSSTRTGYLVVPLLAGGPSGRIDGLLRTSDGGSTWHPQFVVAGALPEFGIAAPGGTTDYLLGGSSALLSSTTGGEQGAPSTLTITTERRRLTRRGRIRVTGRLSPATGSETVTVMARRPGATGWTAQTVKVAGNGSFTTSWNVTRGLTTFVGQWAGDFRSRGDGSPTVDVRVGPRRSTEERTGSALSRRAGRGARRTTIGIPSRGPMVGVWRTRRR